MSRENEGAEEDATEREGVGGGGRRDTAETPGMSAGSRLAEGNIPWEQCER